MNTIKEEIPQLALFNMQDSQEARFKEFHQKYPQVYRLFEKFSLQLLQAGHTHIGSKMIIERIRWEYVTASKDDEGFKINNNFTCYYSRLFMRNNPKHEGCFETRTIKRA